MNHKIHLTALVFVFSLCQLSAQDLQFDLSKYQLPDYKRQLLDLNFNLSGSNQMNEYKGSDGKNKSNNYNNSFSASYNGYLNTREIQKVTNYSLNMYSYYSKYKNANDKYDSNIDIHPTLNASEVNRFFYRTKKYFEIDYSFRYEYSNQKRENTYNNSLDYVNTYKEQMHSIFTTIPVKLGFGRIEQVQDARQSVYILNELNKKQRIAKAITDDDIIGFATLISQLNNERYFDWRLQKIHELEAVDSFLRNGNYVSNNDITYFSILNDFWDFGNQQNRRAGSTFAVALYPSFNYNNIKNESHSMDYSGTVSTTDEKATINAYAISGGFEFKHEKPISLSFQSATDVSTLIGMMRVTEKDTALKVNLPNFQVNATQRIGYYPNTRTNLDFYVSGSFVKFIDVNSDDVNMVYLDGIGAMFSSGLNYNYYFSPQFRFNANWSANYIWQDSDNNVNMPFNQVINGNQFSNIMYSNSNYTEKGFYQYFNIGLVYSFF